MPIQFPAAIELSNLNGANGFKINGIAAGDYCGSAVHSSGDINEDGIDDIIVGAFKASPNGKNSGQSYVVFGSRSIGFEGVFELYNLNGNNGYKLNGIAATSYSGNSFGKFKDLNADGLPDIIIGAKHSGQAHVVYGGKTVGESGTIELDSLNGENGFQLNGDYHYQTGYSVSGISDINGDGFDDLIVGAPEYANGAGRSYIVFGEKNIPTDNGGIDLSLFPGQGDYGFKVSGYSGSLGSGHSVSEVLDINDDGFSDAIIGAQFASPNGESSGRSYVIFGGPQLVDVTTFELSGMNGKNGFTINGIAANNLSGFTVSHGGDVNGDGINDLLISAPHANVGKFIQAGHSYIIFGRANIGESSIFELSDLNGSNGLIINGIASYDYSGTSISSAGDINADGFDDIIIGAPQASIGNRLHVGQVYIVFGSQSIGSSGSLDLSNLNGRNGFILNGINLYDSTGISVASAGDINDDGVTDVIAGAYKANSNGINSGCAYVLFGDSVQLLRNQLQINQGETIILTKDNINATSINHLDETLQYKITDIEHGHFEYVVYPNKHITTFYQGNITNSQVQFVQDWSTDKPSYKISVTTNMWASTIPEEAVINFGGLILDKNNLNITQGETLLINQNYICGTNNNVLDGSLLFTIKDMQHGHFEAESNPGAVISSFLQERILNNDILFVDDGTPNMPSYNVVLSNSMYALPPSTAKVTFQYIPTLVVNALSIQQGGSVLLTSDNLKATDRSTPAEQLVFCISVLKHGRFEFVDNRGITINQFSQADITSVNILFIQDGSEYAPSYNVSVKANSLSSLPKAASIDWTTIAHESTKNNTERTILITSFTIFGVFASLLFYYTSMGYLKNRRLNATAKNKDTEQEQYYVEIIIPVAKSVFKHIKVTGFMNYISNNKMEAYVAEIATVVNEINRLGIDIEIQHMSPERSTELLTQIIKQMKKHLNIQTNKCNRAWFTSFFKPQVTPEMIAEKAKAIAKSVHKELLGEYKNRIINLPPNVDLTDIAGQAPGSDGFTTGYVQMP